MRARLAFALGILGEIALVVFFAPVKAQDAPRRAQDAPRRAQDAGITLVTSSSAWGTSTCVLRREPTDQEFTILSALPRWSIMLRGDNAAPVQTCVRCARVLPHDPGTHLSGGIELRNDEGRVFFDGCMRCLEAELAPVTSR